VLYTINFQIIHAHQKRMHMVQTKCYGGENTKASVRRGFLCTNPCWREWWDAWKMYSYRWNAINTVTTIYRNLSSLTVCKGIRITQCRPASNYTSCSHAHTVQPLLRSQKNLLTNADCQQVQAADLTIRQ